MQCDRWSFIMARTGIRSRNAPVFRAASVRERRGRKRSAVLKRPFMGISPPWRKTVCPCPKNALKRCWSPYEQVAAPFKGIRSENLRRFASVARRPWRARSRVSNPCGPAASVPVSSAKNPKSKIQNHLILKFSPTHCVRSVFAVVLPIQRRYPRLHFS